MSGFKPFAALKGVMGGFERKISAVNSEPVHGLDKAEKIAVPVSGNIVKGTPGSTLALFFKNADIHQDKLSISKTVFIVKDTQEKFETPTVKIVRTDYQGDLNTEQNKTDRNRKHRKINPSLESIDKEVYETSDSILLITIDNPYFRPPLHVKEHNAVAGNVVQAYLFSHQNDAEPLCIVEVDYTHLEKSKTTEELLAEQKGDMEAKIAQERAERDAAKAGQEQAFAEARAKKREEEAKAAQEAALAFEQNKEQRANEAAAKKAEQLNAKAAEDARRAKEREEAAAKRKAEMDEKNRLRDEERAAQAKKREEERLAKKQ
ncbi:MAG: hypothetical protein KBD63_07740 [Bacteriovoracaceae bacterium]|nr:hypothetical protein [Bacteriovoracaceae bacterium]